MRRKVLLVGMLGAMALLMGRAFDLHVLRNQFLKHQGDLQHVSAVSVSAYRGMIKDRNGEPLAISTPVESIWINPSVMQDTESSNLRIIENVLQLKKGHLSRLIRTNPNKQFMYVKRRVNPQPIQKLKDLKIAGLNFEREFRRFYPSGPVSSHVVGFTNIDDVGQEGVELKYESVLRGIDGKKRVIRDGKRRVIGDVESIKAPIDGDDVQLSIDQRIQYLAFRELKAGFIEHKALSASLIVLDAKTGDILADVNQPSFNPNTRQELKGKLYRNRAVTDVFEPGSTVKPFVIAAALDGGYVYPKAKIETHGFYRVGRNLVKDVHNYGTLSLTGVLKKSSNVATSMIALKMPKDFFWGVYNQLGFGRSADVGFPGEASGTLSDYHRWNEFAQATLSFGYGLNSSMLQLARAYTALADNGILHSTSLLKREQDEAGQKVFTAQTARRVRAMLEHVVSREGTAFKAKVDGYSIAGKTGTVKKVSESGGYSKDKYLSIFVGMAPAKDPEIVVAVLFNEPSAGPYYGGLVAAPVFSKLVAGTLRVLGVAPDQEESMPIVLANKESY